MLVEESLAFNNEINSTLGLSLSENRVTFLKGFFWKTRSGFQINPTGYFLF